MGDKLALMTSDEDGQEAGEMLLDIEARIGELLPPREEALKTASPGKGKGRGKSDKKVSQ